MKFVKEKDGSRYLKTKRYNMWLGSWFYILDWALPFHINIESWDKDYANIYLHVLCFGVDFTRISHEYLKELNKISEDIKNEKN